MSTVKVTSFVAYKAPARGSNSPVEILFGAQAHRFAENNSNEFLAGSIPLGKGIPVPNPQEAVILLYGFRDAPEELKRRRQEARVASANFHHCEIDLEVGNIVVKQVDVDMIQGLRFASVPRMTVALQNYALARFNEYLHDEGTMIDESAKRLEILGERPDLWVRLLKEDNKFKSLEVLIIPIMEATGLRYAALVRPNCNITAISQGNDGDTLVFPYIKPSDNTPVKSPTKKAPGRAKKDPATVE